MKKTIFTLVIGFLLVGSINVYAIYNSNLNPVSPPLPEPFTMIILGSGLLILADYIKKFKK